MLKRLAIIAICKPNMQNCDWGIRFGPHLCPTGSGIGDIKTLIPRQELDFETVHYYCWPLIQGSVSQNLHQYIPLKCIIKINTWFWGMFLNFWSWHFVKQPSETWFSDLKDSYVCDMTEKIFLAYKLALLQFLLLTVLYSYFQKKVDWKKGTMMKFPIFWFAI